ncbi:uncharacterized protein LOC124461129 [Drosophila willistoni]|uniref:uncharacterized protein LOC124460954 n=1 Tax=Drosophila willistoni TaxID=7260 RepID=UPI001F07A8BA|nr:uncharacterized protein LOC124460954 [Drosophila willistoni]XP_046868643.1 uncharacterized protein LOC124461129 [Drosophila willistoni]
MGLPTTNKIDVSILRKVSDGTNEIVRGLDAINQTGRDCWIQYLVLEKLDADTRRRWIERSMGNEAPTLEEFFKFLDDRCEELELSKREITFGGKTPAQITHTKQAHVLGKITSTLERQNIDASALDVFSDLQLADSVFTTSAPIDVLLGGEHVWSTITGKKLYDNTGKLIAISSIFGWVISSRTMPEANNAFALTSYIDVNASLQRFWELEDISSTTKLEPDDEQVEKHFLATHTRDEKGKYIVELPLKVANPEFGDTLQGALNLFQSVERRLQQDANLRAKYVNFMREYFDLGHMRELPPDEVNNDQRFYLPHYPVLGRKLRVVFDGSFCDTKGKSLNDYLFTGPSIQRDLFAVCLRFRMYKFVFSADIVKMFRQIWVNNKHRNCQRIVWRKRPSDPIKHYQLCTVIYGTSCAPFLAVRVLEQLATDHQQEFPNAEKSYKRILMSTMCSLGQTLGKWVSNTPRIPTEGTDSTQSSPVKVLGLYWQPGLDTLSYNVGLKGNVDCTKRQVLSDVSRIFDPLGLLAPIVVQFKILFQQLWLLDLGWDDKLPKQLADNWLKWRADLDMLLHIQIPRLVVNDTDNIELHGFSDASTKAYAAVVYSRVINKDGSISTSIMAAKSRVAPLKQQSLPRLELCAALLLSQLIRSIKAALRHQKVTVFAWCDSTIVLYWLSYAPSRLKTFVGNRTSEILDTIPRHYWRHVDSKSNPADCASRGLMAADLKNFQLWWNEPSWIRDADQFMGPFGDKGSNCLTFEEITAARIVYLRHAQTCFQDDYQLLLANKPLRSRSQLTKLSPMIDKDGLLRVGGRLHHSQLSTEAKHPVLLPKSHCITKLILESTCTLVSLHFLLWYLKDSGYLAQGT